MRSRYSAFAMGLGAYLVKTLAAEHPDLAMDREALTRALSQFRSHQRFMGLTVLEASEHGDAGQVLFFARIFERGENRSFAELSDFVRESGAWRYASGVLVRPEELPEPSRTNGAGLTRATFLEIAQRLGLRS